MDEQLSKIYETKFKSVVIEDHKVLDLIGFGKSAAVFKAINESNKIVAVKIFDNQIVEKYGHETQETRIQNELELKGHSIENLVQILGGGNYNKEDEEYLYIIMEYVEGENLKNYISRNGAQDEDFVKNIFMILKKATDELINRKIVHRDIKPENIMIDNNMNIILMDLGVVKKIDHPSITDHSGSKPFLGTLRYAPPEYLFRDEEENEDCWKSINLYQIGATLHDLIMGKELFHQYGEPYTKLVLAIKEENPSINRIDFSQRFLQFVRNLLVKNWKKRLELYNKADINQIFTSSEYDDKEKVIDTISAKTQPYKEKVEIIKQKKQEFLLIRKRKSELANKVVSNIQNVMNSLKNKEIIGGHTVIDTTENSEVNANKYVYEIKGELSNGFSGVLIVIFILSADEHSVIEFSLNAVVSPSIGINPQTRKKRLENVFKQARGLIKVFEGIYDEMSLLEQLERIVIKLTDKAIDIMKPWVESELEWRAKMAVARPGVHNRLIERREDHQIKSIE